SRRETAEIEQFFAAPLDYHGAVQGRFHSWYKDAASPYFDLRDIQNGELVKCFYSPGMYKQLHDSIADDKAILHVSGLVSADRIDRRPVSIRATKIKSYSPLSREEFERFYGIAPNLTGDADIDEYVALIRGDNGG